MMKIYL